MDRVRKGYVDIAGGQLHYRAADGAEPAILFLHQTAASGKAYEPLLAALRLPNRLVALDTPGFGGSFDVEGWPTLADYAGQIVEAADALGADRFHLVGHHTGACLALEIAAACPERTLSVTQIGPVFMTPDERRAFIEGYRAPITPERDGSHLMKNWGYSATHNPDCSAAMLQDGVVDLLRAWRARPQAYMAVAYADTAARAAEVKCPVLLMTSPTDFFHATFDRAEALFPTAAVATVGGDNYQATADPEGVARALESFIGAL